MRAFVIDDYAGSLNKRPVPTPPPPTKDEVQLQLIGTSINPIDRLLAGGYGGPLFNPKQEFPVKLGRDGVAKVMAIGPKVRDLHEGQRVLVASSPRSGGTYSDLFNLPRKCLAPIDDRLSDTTAAGLGYAGLTALLSLASVGLSPESAKGKRLCINGSSGGVGSIALVLASHWGANVTAVASLKHHQWMQSLGACTTVDYQNPAEMAAIRADIVLNCATPSPQNHPAIDPLLDVVKSSNARYRAYATTITPILTNITQNGVVPGLAASGATFLKRRLALRLRGIRYHWVMFKESPQQLAQLVELFSQPSLPAITGALYSLDTLPEHFNYPATTQGPGKAVFMVKAP